MHVVATAGHVDHGKSTLVLALTGSDPDRWAEEKARGLTIDLGFAAMTLPSGDEVAFVDVPGHVRFLKNMIAGVGAVDACMFVVAATEGWKPQSEEHLRILDLLGTSRGIIVLSKVDLVEDPSLVALDVSARVAGTFLADAPIVMSDGVSIDKVVAALADLVAIVPPATDRGRARLWIDRSFPVRGAGTVVTGTLAGGSFAAGDSVVVAPGEIGGRIRALHSHGVRIAHADPGRRVAINLAGVPHESVGRGQAVVAPSVWHSAVVIDCSLSVIDSLDHPVGRRGAYLAYIGSGEFPVAVRILGPAPIEPGSSGFVRLRLPVGLPLQPGDRYVLREAGRAETVGGGEILDVEPVVPASRAAPSRSVQRVVEERGWVEASLLARLIGVDGTAVQPSVGRWVVSPSVLESTRAALTAAASSEPSGVELATLTEQERAVVAAGLPGVVISNGRMSTSAPSLSPAATAALAGLEAGRWSPPGELDRGALRSLAREGLAVDAGGVWFAASAVSDAAASVVASLLSASPEGVTVSQVRDALGSSRKHVVPLLGLFDATGVTRRRGDVRIAGPRLPQRSVPGPSP